MMPTPMQIVLMLTALGNGLAESAKLGQTDSGQKWITVMLSDRAKWDAWVASIPGWFTRLFTGELFKGLPNAQAKDVAPK